MWSFNGLLSVEGISAERPRMKLAYSSSHLRKPFTTQERKKSTVLVQVHVPATPLYFWQAGVFSLKTCATLARGDGKKLLGVAKAHVRISYLTGDCSFILNPVNRLLFGSTFQLPQLILNPKCAVPWVLPLFLPPSLFPWASSLFSALIRVTLNFATFSPPFYFRSIFTLLPALFFFLMETVSRPEPSVTINAVFWSPVGKMGSLHARTRA